MTFQRPVGQESPPTTPGLATAPARSIGGGAPAVGTGAAAAAASTGIARMEYASAAEAWPGGPAPFVRWLRANPDVLGELVGHTLATTADELAGMDGAVFATPEGERLLAVVELGASSETALGSLLTHLAAAQARMALWVCGDPRPEHMAAMSWLNRAVDGRFYVARLRAARIGASDAAPLLDLALRPGRAADASGPRRGPPQRADENGEPAGNGQAGNRRAEDWQEVVLVDESA